jgi:hypothetical protein
MDLTVPVIAPVPTLASGWVALVWPCDRAAWLTDGRADSSPAANAVAITAIAIERADLPERGRTTISLVIL